MEPKKQERTSTKRAISWKLDTSIIELLKAIADHQGESQALILRDLIRKEARRLKLSTP